MSSSPIVWAPPIDASTLAYTSGDPNQFGNLVQHDLNSGTGTDPAFENDLAAVLSLLGPTGFVAADLDNYLAAIDAATAPFAVDETAAVLTDVASIGAGIDASVGTLGFLADFGLSPLGALSDVISTVLNNIFSLAGIANSALDMVFGLQTQITNIMNILSTIPVFGGIGGSFGTVLTGVNTAQSAVDTARVSLKAKLAAISG